MSYKISIIVPVYNVEKYLEQCLNSIINQTYKNLEIILVDDGSTDNSSDLCDLYAKNDKRIKIIHKINGGLSDARNVGLNVATGDFIGFVDSDDWIELDMYEIMLNAMLKSGSDIVSCGHFVEYKNKNYKVSNENKEINNSNIVKNYYSENNVFYGVCMRLYKNFIWKDLQYPVGKLYEDVFVFLESFLKADKIFSISDCLYHYRQRKSSTMGKNFDKKQLDLIEGHNKNLKIISEKFPIFIAKAKKEILLGEKDVLLKALNFSSKDSFAKDIILKFQNDIRKNLKFIIFSSLFSAKHKVVLGLAALNLKLFNICVNIKRNIGNEYYE